MTIGVHNSQRSAAPISPRQTKAACAAALAEWKRAKRWSNSEAAAALGCSEGTVRNRLDGDDADKQMTVHELVRSIQSDGAALATSIIAPLVGCTVEPEACPDSAPDALAAAGQAARCAAEIIAAAVDGIDPDEARALLPRVSELEDTLAGMGVRLRAIIAAGTERTRN